jgi:hypothetical protein
MTTSSKLPARVATLASAMALCLIVAGNSGCPNTCQPAAALPTLTASVSGNQMLIGGSGFTPNLAQCAHLAVTGLPTPDAFVPIGMANCKNGGWTSFKFTFSFVGCTPTTTVPAVVLGVDQGNLATASATVQFPWGPGCALSGTCGHAGQRACPGGCVAGTVNQSGDCVACGAEGQPVCSDGSCTALCPDGSCQGALNPMTQNGQTLCTSLCGFAQGAQCTAAMNKIPGNCLNGVLISPEAACLVMSNENRVYTCYGNSMLPTGTATDCLCYPNTTGSLHVLIVPVVK